MEFQFPLYRELNELKGAELTLDEQTAVLAKITQLDSDQAEVVYAIMQAYAHETATRSTKTAKERFGGSWLVLKPKKGVRFKVDKVPADLRILLTKYILFITGDPRIE